MEYIYYIQENNKTSNPLTFEELKAKKIDENTFVWRKGLKDWVKARELNELENYILFSPPPIPQNIEEFDGEQGKRNIKPIIEENKQTNKVKEKIIINIPKDKNNISSKQNVINKSQKTQFKEKNLKFYFGLLLSSLTLTFFLISLILLILGIIEGVSIDP